METNTSGQGKQAEIPREIQGWSWGAFLLNWIWGIGNNTYRAFWVFFPFVNLFMLVALGLKGNEWAWRHRRWESVEHFKAVQRKWAKFGLAAIVAIILLIVGLIVGVGSLLKNSVAYNMSFALVSDSQEVREQLGSPLKSGFVSGNFETSGSDGAANLGYNIEGPNGEAGVVVEAVKKLDFWTIECLVVNYQGSLEQTVIVPCN